MINTMRGACAFALSWLAGCSLLVDTSGLTSPGGGDGGALDGSLVDGSLVDASIADAALADDALADTGPAETGPADAGGDASVEGGRDASSAYRDRVLADGPKGYFRLGEASGTTAADLAPAGAPGIYEGTLTLGVPGAIVGDPDTAVRFLNPTSVTSVVTLGDRFEFAGTLPFSVEAWVNAKASDGLYHHIFTREQRTTPKQGYAVLIDTIGTVVLERFIGSSGLFSVDGPLTPNGFTHVVAVYDGSALRLFLNGAQVGGDVADTRSAPSFAIPAYIGGASPAEDLFDGVIDEVAVYDKALTAAQVKAHHDLGVQ